MVYRKLEVLVDRQFRVTLSQLSRGVRLLLFEELEVFAGTEDKSLYRSQIIEDEVVYEIGIGGVLLATVFINEDENTVTLLDFDLF